MSNSNIPPELVAMGPGFRRFSAELLLKIFRLLVANCLGSLAAPTEGHLIEFVMNQASFWNCFGATEFLNILHVCKGFNSLLQQAFYEFHKFKLVCTDPIRWGRFRAVRPPALPPVDWRYFVRRLHIEIPLHDWWVPDQPGGTYPVIRNKITTVAELMEYCPGARTLASLTDETTGFGRLDHLELDILVYVHFRKELKGAIQVFRDAGFSVRAGTVVVKAKGLWGKLEDWHREVEQAIGKD